LGWYLMSSSAFSSVEFRGLNLAWMCEDWKWLTFELISETES
jgi:hypothetical protein